LTLSEHDLIAHVHFSLVFNYLFLYPLFMFDPTMLVYMTLVLN